MLGSCLRAGSWLGLGKSGLGLGKSDLDRGLGNSLVLVFASRSMVFMLVSKSALHCISHIFSYLTDYWSMYQTADNQLNEIMDLLNYCYSVFLECNGPAFSL